MGSSFSRPSQLEFYTPVSHDLYITSMYNRYKLPLDGEGDDSVLVVSTTAENATLWVVAYTVLVTMIFMATCELATLMVLTYFRVGNSGTRHSMLVAYYNAGSPSRIIPLMGGYIYNGLFRCRKAGRWAVDWTAVTASFLLFSIAFCLLSGDLLTRFFLGGKALIQGHVAQVNPQAVFYPDFRPPGADEANPNAIFDAYKGPRSPAVYQAITRKTTTGYSGLHAPSGPITFEETITPIINTTAKHPIKSTYRTFRYQYAVTGYDLGLRDAPSLLFSVDGHCETFYGDGYVMSGPMALIGSKPNDTESVDAYPFPNRPMSELQDSGTFIPLERENFTAPWAYFHFAQTDEEKQESGNWTFQLVPHTAYRVSRTKNPKNPTDPLDPWYETEDNPEWDESKDDMLSPYNAPFRVKSRRPPIRCSQRDTFSYNGASVNSPDNLKDLEAHGLKLSPFVQFVLQREFGIPVFAPILGYAPIASLASAVHFVPNERRLDAAKANISTDFRELIEIGYVYSREVVRNTVLLFPSLESVQHLNPDEIIFNVNTAGSNYSAIDHDDADFLIDSQDVAALSVVTLIATPVVCAILWVIVLTWTCIFNSQTKLDNNSASGRHGLRRSGLQATHLYLFLDEQLSDKRKWSGRQSNAPYIRNLDQDNSPPHERLSILMNPGSAEKTDIEAQTTSLPTPDLSGLPPPSGVLSEFSKPKVVPVAGFSNNQEESKTHGVWGWVKENIFGIQSSRRVKYEVRMTRTWNPAIPPVKREEIQVDI